MGAQERSSAEGGGTIAPAMPLLDATLVRSVQGPPGEIVVLLGNAGITAAIQQGAVVADADADAVRDALAGRPDGNVPVYVR